MNVFLKILFGVLRRFQHCTGHITTGSLKGRGNQYIQFARVVYCKQLTNGKQLPAFPLKAITGIEPRSQRWEARVLPLCHHGPESMNEVFLIINDYNNSSQYLNTFSIQELQCIFDWDKSLYASHEVHNIYLHGSYILLTIR